MPTIRAIIRCSTCPIHPTRTSCCMSQRRRGSGEGGPNYPLSPPDTPEGQQCQQDLQALGLSSAPLQYGPDTVWSYEIGEKATFFDRKMIFNSSVYYIDWRDVQQPVALQCGEYFNINATNAYVVGGEYELQAQLGEHF